MILIADSGSTKTDWVLLDNKSRVSFQTEGINPYLMKSEEAQKTIQNNISSSINPELICEIYFYGPGCSNQDNCHKLSEQLSMIFPNSKNKIYTDILGASRALYGKENGLAGILGTGSNICYYNGNDIEFVTPSLGYILGDEGSGNHMGRLLVTDILYKKAPDDLIKIFNDRFGLSKNQILTTIYNKEYPNRFLASFSEFICENIKNEYIESLVLKSFNELFKTHIAPVPDYKTNALRFVGSVAYYFEKQLKETANQYEISIDKIIKNPIEGIVDYHQNNPSK